MRVQNSFLCCRSFYRFLLSPSTHCQCVRVCGPKSCQPCFSGILMFFQLEIEVFFSKTRILFRRHICIHNLPFFDFLRVPKTPNDRSLGCVKGKRIEYLSPYYSSPSLRPSRATYAIDPRSQSLFHLPWLFLCPVWLNGASFFSMRLFVVCFYGFLTDLRPKLVTFFLVFIFGRLPQACPGPFSELWLCFDFNSDVCLKFALPEPTFNLFCSSICLHTRIWLLNDVAHTIRTECRKQLFALHATKKTWRRN